MEQDNKYTYTPLTEPIPITEQEWPEGILPLVYTRTMTYMHESYIRECIEGIIMQKTTFPVQVLIHDDASTDKTAEIVREYEQKYPRLIKAYYQKENSFSKTDKHERRAEFMKWRIGKYEAICEGDDYWTDPYKLQKQVNFLEANPDYSLCCHRFKRYNEEKKTWSVDYSKSLFKKGIEGIAFDNKLNFTKCWLTQTMTIVYRKDALDQSLLSKYKYRCDAHIYYHILKSGKGYCMNYNAAVYRLHVGGVHSKTGSEKRFLHDYNIYNELYCYNQDDDMLKFMSIKMTMFEHLFNKRYSIALAKDIIFVLKMTFHYAGLKKSIATLLKVIILLFRINLFFNIRNYL